MGARAKLSPRASPKASRSPGRLTVSGASLAERPIDPVGRLVDSKSQLDSQLSIGGSMGRIDLAHFAGACPQSNEDRSPSFVEPTFDCSPLICMLQLHHPVASG